MNCLLIIIFKTFYNLFLAKTWFILNPQHMEIKEHTLQSCVWLKKRLYYIEKCKDSKSIGIIIGTLSADRYMEAIDHLIEISKKRGIRSYIISVGKINTPKLANFMDIDIFVLIGCPYNTLYTSREFYKPVISYFEYELALNPKWDGVYPSKFSTQFKDILPNGIHFKDFNELDIQNDVSLISGQIRKTFNDFSTKKDTTDLNRRTNLDLCNTSSSAESFFKRKWHGLNQSLENRNPAIINRGRVGIPVEYNN